MIGVEKKQMNESVQIGLDIEQVAPDNKSYTELYRAVGGDEYFTLEKDAETIAQHIIRPLKVWLPFNDRGKAFDNILPKHGHKVICTDTDFFKTDPPSGCNAVISNPPFSRKKEVIERLNDFGIKYAIIIPFLWLNDGVPFDYCTQVMFFRKRMAFIDDKGSISRPRSNCVVISNGILTHDCIVIH